MNYKWYEKIFFSFSKTTNRRLEMSISVQCYAWKSLKSSWTFLSSMFVVCCLDTCSLQNHTQQVKAVHWPQFPMLFWAMSITFYAKGESVIAYCIRKYLISLALCRQYVRKFLRVTIFQPRLVSLCRFQNERSMGS